VRGRERRGELVVTPASSGMSDTAKRSAALDRIPASIDEFGRWLRSGRITTEQVVQEYLERIRRFQPSLNAFITVTEERALSCARDRDLELRRGVDRGPLHGVPVVYKDNIDTRGVATTVGSALLRDRVPDADAAMVERLEAAGSVMLGKANMSEFASGSSGVNVFFGSVHNPWDLARAPGGSSSGNGAAVAADLCLASVGTDAGGSIRQPSGRCGVFGLRPTFGRVSLAGVWPRTRTLGVAGPMTHCVKDAALMMNALAGFDPRYAFSLDVPAEDFTRELGKDVAGLRLGVIEDYTFSHLDPEIEATLRLAVEQLEELGARLVPIRIPELIGALDYATLFSNVLLYEFNDILGPRYREADRALFGPAVHSDIARGASVSRETYQRTLDQRPAQAAAVKAVFDHVDALLAPILPNLTPLQSAGAEVWARGRQFNLPFSFVGVPSVSVPCGFVDGMPVGLQIVANDLQESLLLRIASAYEQATDHHSRRPPLTR